MQHVPRWIIRIGLAGVWTLVFVKSAALGLGRSLRRPLGRLWQALLPRVVLPVYHAGYMLRRRLELWYRPAKNRLMYALANRHMTHIVAAGVAVAAVVVNLSFNDVRAETYGERSLMYALATGNDTQLIDEYVDTEAGSVPAPTRYRTDGTLVAQNLSVFGETDFVLPTVRQNGAFAAVPTSAASASRAPRERVETYTVAEGDTLSTIAESFGISLNTLLWANNLTVRSVVRPGQVLTILPVSGVLHTVKSGDNLSKIGATYSVATVEIVAYNNLDANATLQAGDQLIIPGGQVRAPAPVSRKTTATSIFSTTPGTATTKTNTSGSRMLWPTDLTYIVRGLSWYHTGIDIDCNGHRNGSSTNHNYAAADGYVQFAGVKSGYGTAIEINHGNGLVTRYGHFYELYVSKGDQVTTGTPLGVCGSTGNSSGTHLHFEVIANGKYANPLEYVHY